MAEASASPATQAPEEEPVEPVSFGLWWPAGDPGKLREAADAWDAMASYLDTATTTLSGAASAVTGANSGAAIDAFAAHWGLVGGPQGALPTIAGGCRSMATSLREFADAVDEVREQIIQMAVEIAATIAIGAGLAIFTAGLSAGAAAATTTAMVARAAAVGVNLGIRAATIISRVAIGAGVGAVEGMAANTVVQLGSNAVFNDNHDPFDGFNLGEVAVSGAFGFVGGGTIGGIQGFRWLRRVPTIAGRPPINSRWAGQIYNGKGWTASLAAKYPNGVRFTKQGFPNFGPYAKARVQLNNLTGRYATDAAAANRAVGLSSTPKGYVWHHVEDGRKMILIPKELHNAVRHHGGAAVIRNSRVFDPDWSTNVPARAINTAGASSTASAIEEN